MKKKCAFVLIHFGSNIKYLELELYFLRMLALTTTHDIVYLYSVSDTPDSFIKQIKPLVTHAYFYDDTNITYNITQFKSNYMSFNTLRTCNFIFAYTLTQYDTICIVESDMILLKNIDALFDLKTPAILNYQIRPITQNKRFTNNSSLILEKCDKESFTNGGILVFSPSQIMFEKYKQNIQRIIGRGCKYPNETLFCITNLHCYNVPVQYNFSHYHANRLASYHMSINDICIMHFNETDYKHLDILNEQWLSNMTGPKYAMKLRAIQLFQQTVYDRYKPNVLKQLNEVLQTNAVKKTVSIAKGTRCTKGTRRNKKTGKCESIVVVSITHKLPRCKKGTRRNKKTKQCEPH